jgi:hypothetical protein
VSGCIAEVHMVIAKTCNQIYIYIPVVLIFGSPPRRCPDDVVLCYKYWQASDETQGEGPRVQRGKEEDSCCMAELIRHG